MILLALTGRMKVIHLSVWPEICPMNFMMKIDCHLTHPVSVEPRRRRNDHRATERITRKAIFLNR